MKKYYDILQVNPKASPEIIDNAYTVLKRKHSSGIKTNELQEIEEAYQVLSSSFLRQQYDLEIEKENMAQMEKMYQNIENNNKNTFESNREDGLYGRRKEIPVGNRKIEKWVLPSLFSDWKNVLKNRKEKKITKQGALALALTLVVMIVVGLILWFIPFTKPFIEEFFFIF